MDNVYIYFTVVRSIRPEVLCKKGVLECFAKFTGKLYQSLILNKVSGLRPATLLKKRLWHSYFLSICEIFKNTFFIEHLWMTTSTILGLVRGDRHRHSMLITLLLNFNLNVTGDFITRPGP